MRTLRRHPRTVVAALAVAGLVALAWGLLGARSTGDDIDTFRYAVATDCITLDPQNTSSLVDFRVIETLYDGLLAVTPGAGTLRPAAAAALPEVSDDGRTLTFRIDPAARWSNGDRVTSADFAFSWTRSLATDFAAIYGSLFNTIDGAVELSALREEQLAAYRPGVDDPEALWREWLAAAEERLGIDASDPATLVVRLTGPVAYFPQLTAFGVFRPTTGRRWRRRSPSTAAPAGCSSTPTPSTNPAAPSPTGRTG